jgi:hypothetical protein
MMRRAAYVFLVVGLVAAAFTLPAQFRPYPSEDPSPMPGIKQEQVTRILKDEHKKSVEDAAELVELSKSLKEDLDEGGYSVVSLTAIRNTEKIEKLARQIRSRLARY